MSTRITKSNLVNAISQLNDKLHSRNAPNHYVLEDDAGVKRLKIVRNDDPAITETILCGTTAELYWAVYTVNSVISKSL